MSLKLNVVVCSTRPGRVGLSIGRWLDAYAKAHGGFEVELVDLADFALPVFDEPEHPRLERYVHDHTRRWSRSVDAADAFVFVMPEYNHAPPAAWLNAMTFLVREWQYKPVAFVSYGAASGGVRGVQIARQIVTTFRMVPILEGIALPWVARQFEDGRLTVPEDTAVAGQAMLGELLRWARLLPALRTPRPA